MTFDPRSQQPGTPTPSGQYPSSNSYQSSPSPYSAPGAPAPASGSIKTNGILAALLGIAGLLVPTIIGTSVYAALGKNAIDFFMTIGQLGDIPPIVLVGALLGLVVAILLVVAVIMGFAAAASGQPSGGRKVVGGFLLLISLGTAIWLATDLVQYDLFPVSPAYVVAALAGLFLMLSGGRAQQPRY